MNLLSPVAPTDPASNSVQPTWQSVLTAARKAGMEPQDADALEAAIVRTNAAAPNALETALLCDTLALLATLNTESELLLAAILHEQSALQQAMPITPSLKALLEGQLAARQVNDLHDGRAGARNSEGLRSLLLALVKDLRVVLILLARQLARMRHIAQFPESQRPSLIELTRDIHAPLANRLGIWQLKWELEDLVLRHTEPETYSRIAKLLDEKRVDRERFIAGVTKDLQEALDAQGLQAKVMGRPKHIYSIWKKMSRKEAPIGELYDLRAVRILVSDVTACYTALGIVHSLWLPIPSEFDDYIARPKRNDYRSLHTAVIGPQGKTLEVQIRTFDMHDKAELGVAAHWRYKEGSGNDAALDRKIAWMRSLLDQSPDELGGALKNELEEDRIYVLTPKGEVVDLPVGGTPLDFAYHVHTEVGHRTRGAKVNGNIVNLDAKLKTGDRVEILTGKVSEPRRDWLVEANGFLASQRSRGKVRAWFNKLDRERNIVAGKELLDKELRRVGLLNADLREVLAKFNAATEGDLQVLVALGDVGPSQVVRAVQEAERERERPADLSPSDGSEVFKRAKPMPATQTPFVVGGEGNLLVQIARCCQPVRGEPIVGYLTKGRGISVHRPDCGSLLRLRERNPERVLAVEWGGSVRDRQEVDIQVDATDRRFLLKDISDTLASADTPVVMVNSERNGRQGQVRVVLRLRVSDFEQLAKVLGRLAALPGVHHAFRRQLR